MADKQQQTRAQAQARKTRAKSKAAKAIDLELARMNHRYGLLQTLLKPLTWAILAGVVGFFLWLIVKELAGRETVANIDIAVSLAVTAAFSIAWRLHVVQLRHKCSEQAERLVEQRQRITELETLIHHRP